MSNFGERKAALNQRQLLRRCGDTALGLLLEDVQHIQCVVETYRVNRPIGIAIVILGDFEYAGAGISGFALGCLSPI